MKEIISKKEILERLRNELPRLQDMYGVDRIAIYGSFAKEIQKTKSDIDILVQLRNPLGLQFVELANDLEGVVGRRVDVATFESLERGRRNPRYKHIAEDILKTLSYV